MVWRQSYSPNLDVKAWRGWCLRYIDDAGAAPTRRANAQLAANAEAAAKRLRRNQDFPVGVWVVGFWSLTKGQYAGLGHVAFIKKHANGRIEIRDSEVRSGARGVYTSVAEVNRWFGNFGAVFLGWSTHCDGRKYAEEYTPPKPKPAPAAKKYITVQKGWGLSNVAQAAGFKDFGSSPRWAAIAKLNGSNDWKKFNNNLKPGQKVRVK